MLLIFLVNFKCIQKTSPLVWRLFARSTIFNQRLLYSFVWRGKELFFSRCIFEGFLCLPVATPYPPYSALDQWEAFGNWLFFVNKYLELLDTMWIILRQKFNQLTFLHVYHHSTVLLVFLPLARFTPTGE